MAPKRPIQKRKRQLDMAIRKSPSSSPSSSQNSTPSSSNSSSPRSMLSKEELTEMRRLGKMLPVPMQLKNPREDPLTLINDATKYINHLTATVVARVQKGSLPREVLDMLSSQALSLPSLPDRSTPKPSKRRRALHRS